MARWAHLANIHNYDRYLNKLNYVDSIAMRRYVQRALNRGESYHKLYRAVAYAYSGKLRVKTKAEQQSLDRMLQIIG